MYYEALQVVVFNKMETQIYFNGLTSQIYTSERLGLAGVINSNIQADYFDYHE